MGRGLDASLPKNLPPAVGSPGLELRPFGPRIHILWHVSHIYSFLDIGRSGVLGAQAIDLITRVMGVVIRQFVLEDID